MLCYGPYFSLPRAVGVAWRRPKGWRKEEWFVLYLFSFLFLSVLPRQQSSIPVVAVGLKNSKQFHLQYVYTLKPSLATSPQRHQPCCPHIPISSWPCLLKDHFPWVWPPHHVAHLSIQEYSRNLVKCLHPNFKRCEFRLLYWRGGIHNVKTENCRNTQHEYSIQSPALRDLIKILHGF